MVRPGLEDAEAARHDPSALEQLDIHEIVEFYADVMTRLDRQPIIMVIRYGPFVRRAHHTGLARPRLGIAGVSIDSAPIKGNYKLPWSTLKSSF